jgi:hypothetical protein
MEVHAHTHTARKKMDPLFMGILNVVPCCVQRGFWQRELKINASYWGDLL